MSTYDFEGGNHPPPAAYSVLYVLSKFLKQTPLFVLQVEDAMLMFDKTTNRHRGKIPSRKSLPLLLVAQLLNICIHEGHHSTKSPDPGQLKISHTQLVFRYPFLILAFFVFARPEH